MLSSVVGSRHAPAHRGNEKGRVERSVQYVRANFFAARPFTTLEDFTRQAWEWCGQGASQRRWPGGLGLTVAQAFEQDQPRLLPPQRLLDSMEVSRSLTLLATPAGRFGAAPANAIGCRLAR